MRSIVAGVSFLFRGSCSGHARRLAGIDSCLCVIAFLSLICLSTVHAQSAVHDQSDPESEFGTTPLPGTKVQIRHIPPGAGRNSAQMWTLGTLLRTGPESWVIQRHGSELETEIPVNQMGLVRFRRGQIRLGAIGGLVGFLAGGLWAAAANEERPQPMDAVAFGGTSDGGAFFLGGLAGAAVGALVGRSIRVDKWGEWPVPALSSAAGSEQYMRLSVAVHF